VFRTHIVIKELIYGYTYILSRGDTLDHATTYSILYAFEVLDVVMFVNESVLAARTIDSLLFVALVLSVKQDYVNQCSLFLHIFKLYNRFTFVVC